MQDYHWNNFIKRVTVKAPVFSLYAAWATKTGLESWFLREAIVTKADGTLREADENFEAGDSFEWRWHGYDDSTVDRGHIISANGIDQLSFTFSGKNILTVNFPIESDEIICSIEQQMQQDTEAEKRYFYIECGLGWTFYLANLKSVFEGGNDLRNKNVAIQKLINA
ncbi:MAG: hypothetical protein NTZ19_11820 [Bacteroidetes bacterium]|nr:hypothetical protein [Bacteroidota bacterium]